MKSLAPLAVVILVALGLVLAYVRWRANYKPRFTYPRGPRKYVEDSHAERSDLAKLISEVLTLKHKDALWPKILTRLNPNDEPQVRTVLLELRGPHIFAPQTALNIIEDACLTAKKLDRSASRLELLEQAKLSIERVTQYGN